MDPIILESFFWLAVCLVAACGLLAILPAPKQTPPPWLKGQNVNPRAARRRHAKLRKQKLLAEKPASP